MIIIQQEILINFSPTKSKVGHETQKHIVILEGALIIR
jgi:hypothetical protein